MEAIAITNHFYRNDKQALLNNTIAVSSNKQKSDDLSLQSKHYV